MRPRDSLFIAFPVSLAAALLARGARADELKPGSGDAGQITAIADGVSELSLEQIFVLGFDKAGSVQNFRMSLLTGPTFRYFFSRNATVGFNAAFLYKLNDGEVQSSDIGGVFTAHVGYMLNLTGGMFLKPIIGGGGFFGQRKGHLTIAGSDMAVQTAIYGGIIRAGLPIYFYSTSRFNLFAGPEGILSLGSASDAKVGGTTVKGDFFLSIDGGLAAGISYVF